ncbi:MAG: hypothetical protein JRJ87_21925 [Deltaproteobacteria bacterium]|nr:hypothetical protein [Deltaproteobacteria bacterium]
MRATVIFVVLAILPTISMAEDVCSYGGLPNGPLGLSFFEGDIGRPRRVCPRTELALTGGLAGIDVADDMFSDDGNFYGTLSGGGELSGSWKFSDKGEIFASIQALHFRFVQNATITKTRMGMGWTSLGATYLFFKNEILALAATGRITLPTAFGYYEHAWPLTLDAGLSAELRPLPRLSIHGQLGAITSFAIGHGDPGPRAAFQLVAGVSYRPWDWLGLVIDLGTQLGYDAPLDQLTAAAGLRFHIWEGLGIELAAMLPFAGETAANMVVGLRVSYRLDGY